MEEGVVYIFSIYKLYSAERAVSQTGFVWFVFFLPGTKFMQGQFMGCMCDGMKIYGHPGRGAGVLFHRNVE